MPTHQFETEHGRLVVEVADARPLRVNFTFFRARESRPYSFEATAHWLTCHARPLCDPENVADMVADEPEIAMEPGAVRLTYTVLVGRVPYPVSVTLTERVTMNDLVQRLAILEAKVERMSGRLLSTTDHLSGDPVATKKIVFVPTGALLAEEPDVTSFIAAQWPTRGPSWWPDTPKRRLIFNLHWLNTTAGVSFDASINMRAATSGFFFSTTSSCTRYMYRVVSLVGLMDRPVYDQLCVFDIGGAGAVAAPWPEKYKNDAGGWTICVVQF